MLRVHKKHFHLSTLYYKNCVRYFTDERNEVKNDLHKKLQRESKSNYFSKSEKS